MCSLIGQKKIYVGVVELDRQYLDLLEEKDVYSTTVPSILLHHLIVKSDYKIISCRFHYCISIVQISIRDGDGSTSRLIVHNCFRCPDIVFYFVSFLLFCLFVFI